MDGIFFPRKISSTFDNVHDKPANAPSPPSYHQATASSSPLLLEETTTTRTEIVTTTTTQTVTHLFAFPPWRKRQVSHTPNPESRHTDDHPRISVVPAGISLNDKALPPTPSGDSSNTGVYFPREPPVTRSEVIGISYSKSSPPSTTAAVTDYPSLGIGHPSTSPSRSFSMTLAPPNSKSRPSTSAGERSALRSQAITSSESPILDSPEGMIAERQRGLSFGSASKKGKGREEPGDIPVTEPKRLVRKTSLWNRRKASQPSELVSPPLSPQTLNAEQPENVVALPPLPPVTRMSPFEVDLFHEKNAKLKHDPQHPHTGRENHHPSQPPGEDPLPRKLTRPSTAKAEDDRPQAKKLRPQTSTPLLRRLSMAVFTHSSNEVSSPTSTSKSAVYTESPTQCAGSLPFPSIPSSRIPRPLDQEGESPEIYLARLKLSVNKSDIASILASSPDVFHVNALRTYFSQFNFYDIPLDVSLRKLLMEVSLPRETQQIDRVIEAFSLRYTQCNPELFTSQDHPHILAFSLIMLHTDAFNRSNKRKMTKADYIKNTKQPGIVTEVLDCFFDNIVFAPFIFIEDPVELDGQLGMSPNAASSPSPAPLSAFPSSNGATFKMTQKIDPYYLIVNNLLDPLRVDVESHVALDNPFSFKGTSSAWDGEQLRRSFVGASMVKLGFPFANSGPVFTTSFTPTSNSTTISPTFQTHSPEARCLRVAEMGILNRKDDLLEGGKRSSHRKWRTWGIILTGTQLLFFRDFSVVSNVIQCMKSSRETLPSLVNRPDEILSVKDAIAVYDRSYKKYAHSMRLAMMDGRQLLLQASDDQELDKWISRVNYASAFRSAGIKMRPPGLSGEDIHLTGVAAATSHLHDMQQMANLSRPHSWGSDAPNDLMDTLAGHHLSRPLPSRSATLDSQVSEYDVPVAPEIEGAEQFKATFDQVKADLMADDDSPADLHLSPQTTFVGDTFSSPVSSPLPRQKSIRKASSRAHIIQTKIRELETKIAAMEPRLSAHRMFIRNIVILTPFQKSTRSRLTAAIQGMAREITQARLDMEKFRCHLFILRNDLTSETLAWEESKDVALRIAKETLRSRRSLPLMTLSPDKQTGGLVMSPTETTLPAGLNTPLTRNRASSSCGSYHSAVDFGFDWSSAEDLFLSSSQHEAPISNGSHTPAPRPSMASARSSTERQKTYHQESDEEAEEWHRTRCAQRVSLVHVPSSFKVASWLKSDPPFDD
ncbi:hypothetical protein BJ165DRAFT_503298 [Panaeolus papilionaceus]|nr:hypothetical protein BJ165DRAFT_503298 [Panaeolus papilionaceus]